MTEQSLIARDSADMIQPPGPGASPIQRPFSEVVLMAKMPDTIMTFNDLSANVKLPKSSICRLCQAGKLPVTKAGQQWWLHKDVIDEGIKDGALPTRAWDREKIYNILKNIIQFSMGAASITVQMKGVI